MTPPVILVGHPNSKRIVKASKYLTSKYMPEFSFTYLNYKGGINQWGNYIAGYLEYLTDENVLFALDDYLIADYINMDAYRQAEAEMIGSVVCVKLCKSTTEEHLEYPVTTQYCIWNRQYLIWLLKETYTPWNFELEGSKIFNKTSILWTCIDYGVHSCLSSRWEGVKLDGLKDEDIKYLKENNLL